MRRYRWITCLVLMVLVVATLLPLMGSKSVDAQETGWAIYKDSQYGYSISYPAEWIAVVTLENQKENAEEIVIDRRVAFRSNKNSLITMDVWHNDSSKTLQKWFDTYQKPMYTVGDIFPAILNARIAGKKAFWGVELYAQRTQAIFSTLLVHNEYIYRVEYSARNDGSFEEYEAIYNEMLRSLRFRDMLHTSENSYIPDSPELEPAPRSPSSDDTCCGRSSSGNPYPCDGGNCTWWARYKRPDIGNENWGHAKNWASRALQEGFTVKATPTVGAIAVDETGDWSVYGHVAYVKSHTSSTITVSEMNWISSIDDCTECATCASARVKTNYTYQSANFEAYIYPDNDPPVVSFYTPSPSKWYNSDQSLSWSISDSSSGVDYYKWAWDDDTPDTQVADSFGSTTLSVAGQGIHTLYIRAWDKEGNNKLYSTGWFGYDTTIPTATMSLNYDAPTTHQSTVHLNLSANDTWSGIAEVRISNNNVFWSEWQPYADIVPWGIPTLDGRTLTVYAQVRDYAGNESAIVSDTITLDLYPLAPHSADYRICNDIFNAGGTVGLVLSGTVKPPPAPYSLVSSIGQPLVEGGGFLGTSGCRPINRSVPSPITLTQQVIASGGNLRSSTGYRLGDTTGESLASGVNVATSADYVLSSGFWAQTTIKVENQHTIYLPLVLRK